jgi:xylulokinase
MSLLGIDVGTTGCRAMAISLEGARLAEAFREYSPVAPASGVCELDSERVWAAIREVIAEVAGRAKQDPIRALSVASMGEVVVPLAVERRILGPSILSSDQRGAQCVRTVEQRLGRERLFQVTGSLPGSSGSLGKLCWMRDSKPQLFEGTWRFVLWNGLVSYLLGGASTCDYSLASRTLLFDLDQKRWSNEVLHASGLSPLKLPELAPAGTPVGTVDAHAARELGLPPGVRIILGGYDLCCSALGMGVIGGGMAMYLMGSFFSMVPTFNAIPLTSLMLSEGLDMGCHVVPGAFVSVLYNQSGGAVLRWFADTVVPLEKREVQKRGLSIYTELLAEMPEEPTDLIGLPHFAPAGPPHLGERLPGGVLGLLSATSRGELIKGLLEGTTYFFADGVERLRKAGISIKGCRVAGGGARSDRWLQLSADILGLPLERVPISDPAMVGAAMLAGVGSGAYAGFEQAATVVVKVEQRFEPQAHRVAFYRTQLERYRELVSLLRELWAHWQSAT